MTKKYAGFTLLIFGVFFSFSQKICAKQDSTLQRNKGDASTVSTPAPPATAGTPTRAIQELENKTDSYKTSEKLSAEDRNYNAKLKHEIITGTFNIQELCRLSLDQHWAKLSPGQQSEFVSLMIQLLEKKAILSKEQSKTKGQQYFVKYLGDTYLDPQKTRAKTKTLIQIPKEQLRIAINYKLIKVGKQWKVFDVIVDDASLLDNYKYQFNSIITKYGYPELVTRIRKKLSEIDTEKS